MHTTDREEIERTKEFVYNYRIQNIEFKNKQEYDRVEYIYGKYTPEYITARVAGSVTMEISERDFLSIVKKVTEYDEFMRYPEVREAILQATFMSRLKGYR